MNISESGWKIVEFLAEEDRTPTELSEIMDMSLPGVYSNLEKLEKKGLIEKKGKKKGKTKPYNVYSLGEGFAYLIKMTPRGASRKFMKVDWYLETHFKIWDLPQREYYYYVEKFWWDIQKDIEVVNSVAVFGSVANGEAREDSDIDILMIVDEDTKKFEKKYGAKLIRHPRKDGKTVMCQIYTKNDFKESLEKGSKFSEEVVKNMKVIYDEDGFLSEVKNDER